MYKEHAIRPDDLSRDDAPWRFITREWLVHNGPETAKATYIYYASSDGETISAHGSREFARRLHVANDSVLKLRKGERRQVGRFIVWREQIHKGGPL